MKLFKLTSVIVLIAYANSSISQNFIISGMSSFSGISSNATTLNFNSKTSCIDVQSGIAVLTNTINYGEFVVNCSENQQFNQLGLRLFPNPVISNTKIRFINTPPLNELFKLSIWDIHGRLLMSRRETGYQVFQGLSLNLNYLIAGDYIFKIESSQFVDAIKFIKIK